VSAFDKISLLTLAIVGLALLVLALIPGLADSATRALVSLRELRRAITGQSAKAPSPDDEEAKQP
jgi:hypothetical protein